MRSLRGLDKSSKVLLVITALVLLLTPFGVMKILQSGDTSAVTVLGASGSDVVEPEEDAVIEPPVDVELTGEDPQIAISYISFSKGNMDVYFTQRNIDKANIDVIVKDEYGKVIKIDGKPCKGSFTYTRGEGSVKLGIKLPMDDKQYMNVTKFEVLADGVTYDDTNLETLLGIAKRSYALTLEDERLRNAANVRATDKARRAAEAEEAARLKAEAEERKKAEEAAKNQAENDLKQASDENKSTETSSDTTGNVVSGWPWGEAYYDMVVSCANSYSSSTNQFIVNDLVSRKLTVLETNGVKWEPVAWFNVNQNGLSSNTTLTGLYSIVRRAPSDSNGSYYVDGAGVNDWMLAYYSETRGDDEPQGGYHLRQLGDGYWFAQGFCHGFDAAWYGGGTDGDGNIYLELDDAKWLYDHIATGTAVLNI